MKYYHESFTENSIALSAVKDIDMFQIFARDANQDVIDDFLELKGTEAKEALFSLRRIIRKYTFIFGHSDDAEGLL
jgi:hypothetical protein